MLSNSDTTMVRNLYKGFHIEAFSVRRAINSNADDRRGKEVIVRNYLN